MAFLQRVRSGYRLTAMMLLNVAAALVLANLLLLVTYRVIDAHRYRHSTPLALDSTALEQIYPGLDRKGVAALLDETWSRPQIYEPFTQFTERPFKGRFVNVSEAGFRVSKDQGPWPPDGSNFNVFLFGGSTTFGYGVADDQTIASYLQASLSERLKRSVRVYNFGCGSYFSSQERVLFEKLLLEGYVPDLAVFVDGLNEFAFHNGIAYTSRLRSVFEHQGRAETVWGVIKGLPMTRFAQFVHRHVAAVVGHAAREGATGGRAYEQPDVVTHVIDRYLANTRLIEAVAQGYGVDVAFVWQPIPLYKYHLEKEQMAKFEYGTNLFARYGYRVIHKRLADYHPDRNFIWCADIQEDHHEPLYVDRVHYTARMTHLLANAIADAIVERGLVPGSPN